MGEDDFVDMVVRGSASGLLSRGLLLLGFLLIVFRGRITGNTLFEVVLGAVLIVVAIPVAGIGLSRSE